MTDRAMTEERAREIVRVNKPLRWINPEAENAKSFLAGLELERKRSEALLGKLTKIEEVGLDSSLGVIVGSEHYEKAWLDCLELAHEAIKAHESGQPPKEKRV